MKFDTIREAAEYWVSTFNAIPMSLIEKLVKADGFCDELNEVTPPCKYDKVEITGDEWEGQRGTIIQTLYDGEPDLYMVRLESGEEVVISSGDFDVDRDHLDWLPMWGTMFAFNEDIDNEWLRGEYLGPGLQLMADCGFRIYEQEDYEYIFGIDGAGYDFYEDHWIPLYKARGLHWHKEEDQK